MYSRKKDLVGDHIEEGKNRSYRKQGIKTLKEEHRTNRGDRD